MELCLVVLLVGDLGGEDDLVFVGDRLSVVALEEPVLRRHHLGLRVGRVDLLVLVAGLLLGGLGLSTAELVPLALLFSGTLGEVSLVRRPLRIELFVEDLFGRLEASAPVLTSTESGGRLVAAGPAELGVFGFVGSLRLGEQLLDGLVDRVVGHVALHGGRGGHLRPIERHEADPGHPCLRAQPERGGEDHLQHLFVTLAEPGDRRVVGKQSGADHPEGDIDMARTLDLAARADPDTVGVEQQRHHRCRVVRCAAPAIGSVVGVEGRQVHLLDRVQHEPRQMVFGQPVRHRRRQQVELVTFWGEEVVGHDVIVATGPVRVVDLPRALPGSLQIAAEVRATGSIDPLAVSEGRRLVDDEPGSVQIEDEHSGAGFDRLPIVTVRSPQFALGPYLPGGVDPTDSRAHNGLTTHEALGSRHEAVMPSTHRPQEGWSRNHDPDNRRREHSQTLNHKGYSAGSDEGCHQCPQRHEEGEERACEQLRTDQRGYREQPPQCVAHLMSHTVERDDRSTSDQPTLISPPTTTRSAGSHEAHRVHE